MNPTTYNELCDTIIALKKQQEHTKALIEDLDMRRLIEQEDKHIDELQAKISDLSHRLDVIASKRFQVKRKRSSYDEGWFQGTFNEWIELNSIFYNHKKE